MNTSQRHRKTVIRMGYFCLCVTLSSTLRAVEPPSPSALKIRSPWYLLNATPGWTVDALLTLESEPTYAGSDDSDTEIGGDLVANYRASDTLRYTLSLGEAGATFHFPASQTVIQLILEYEEGRSAEDDSELGGLDPVEETLELQLALYQKWGPAYGFVVLQPDLLGRGKGFVWFLGLASDLWLVDGLRASLSLDLSGANRSHMQTEFGITEAEARRTPFSAFAPGGGLKSISTDMELEYFISDRFSLLAQVEWERYLADAVDSPLVQIGSKNTQAGLLGFRYRW